MVTFAAFDAGQGAPGVPTAILSRELHPERRV